MSVDSATRTIAITEQFLNFPVKNEGIRRRVTLRVEGLPEVITEIELAEDSPDWYASVDITPWQGKSIKITVDGISPSKGLDSITVSPSLPGDVPAYAESGRGQIRFSSRRGWTNDPNGLVLYRGEYHLFFQHNPYGWGWGPMHWGHAVSKDLVHWTELPIALYPDTMGTMFSGSAVVDWHNTSGFGLDGQPPMVLFYTAAGSPFTQGLAYSLDGRTFEKWSGNPIVGSLATGDRDPKVMWHEPTGQWVMVLYLEIPDEPTMQFLTSADLRHWTPTSRIIGYHECPDLFEFPVQGSEGEYRWVLTAANSNYQVGTFDGSTFVPETEILLGQCGRGFYAAQTFSDVPERRIQIGWFQTETKGIPFNQSMSIPMELGLVKTEEGHRLTWTPVTELESLRDSDFMWTDAEQAFKGFEEELAEVEVEFAAGAGGRLSLVIRGLSVVFEADSQLLTVEGKAGPAPIKDGRQTIRIFVDRVGIEVFASEGRTFMPMPVAPDPSNLTFLLETHGDVTVGRVAAHRLRSAWAPAE